MRLKEWILTNRTTIPMRPKVEQAVSQKIEFSVSIYPSVARPGQFAISVTNSRDESLVIGNTSTAELETTKRVLSRVFNSSMWEYNSEVNYHTLQVVADVANA